jgi:hypothetical protein
MASITRIASIIPAKIPILCSSAAVYGYRAMAGLATGVGVVAEGTDALEGEAGLLAWAVASCWAAIAEEPCLAM